MPDRKISQLGAAASPLGPELVPIVQGGTTLRASAAQLAALAYDPRGGDAVAIGDSITAANNDVRAVGAQSWFALLCSASGQAIRFLANTAVGGNANDAMQARFKADVLRGDGRGTPRIVFIQASLHDYSNGRTQTQWLGSIDAMIADAQAQGCGVAVVNLTPSTSAGATVLAWNAALAARLALPANAGVVPLDAFAVLGNPTTGGWAVASDTNDGIHPTSTGAAKLATQLLAALRGTGLVKPRVAKLLPSVSGESANIVGGGNFDQGQNNGIPTGWGTYGGAGSYTHAVVPASDGVGNAATITVGMGTPAGYHVFSGGGDCTPYAGQPVEIVAKTFANGLASSGWSYDLRVNVYRQGGGVSPFWPCYQCVNDGPQSWRQRVLLPSDATGMEIVFGPGGGPAAAANDFTVGVSSLAAYPMQPLLPLVPRRPYVKLTGPASRTQAPTDCDYVVDATNGAATLTLLPPDQASGAELWLMRQDGSANTVTISGTFQGGATSVALAAGASKHLRATDQAWWVLS